MNKDYLYDAEVTRVIDGDTFDALVDLGFRLHISERFRLYGVNTPESRTKDAEEKKRGNEAKAFVKNAIEGKRVLISSEKQGKFGRYLATVLYDGKKNLNQELIKLGMAVEYYGGKR